MKKAKAQGGDPEPNSIPADGPGVLEFMRTILCLCPTFDYRQLVDQEIDLDMNDLALRAAA
ncbi:MAG: hypothetical protein ACREQ8_06790 [Woeseiaceae bacterium]